MFTGIVEETGRVISVTAAADSIRLVVEVEVCGRGTRVGESIAVDGCCLTIADIKPVAKRRKRFSFDLLQETWNRTRFEVLKPGSLVNLERALAANGRLGGHFVTGHIDGVGRIKRWERVGKDHVLDIAAPRELTRYTVSKGSVAVDGISLTIAAVIKGGFRIWIIPHTLQVTSLQERNVGDRVNLEADLLAKYVEQLGRR